MGENSYYFFFGSYVVSNLSLLCDSHHRVSAARLPHCTLGQLTTGESLQTAKNTNDKLGMQMEVRVQWQQI